LEFELESASGRPWRQDRAGNVLDAPGGSLQWQRLLRDDPMFAQAKAKADNATSRPRSAQQDSETQGTPFSNSLQTSEEFNDS
jgi:hypothetical protein